ncbi:hypothetical protein DFJ74DRAFT_631194 [Hyaloraphidium curvatum]|nr:hypothetical protein DFJ74DRAFT_631194 [Hyaloraphidium curvatum]
MEKKPLVAVTGATGYIAAHCVRLLLLAGARVRGTVRSTTSPKVQFLKELPGASEGLELVEADLLGPDETWDKVVDGTTYVLHVASPFPSSQPEDENVLIKPAVDGTLGVLKAVARRNGKGGDKTKRVVVTSSVAAIANGWGQEGEGRTWKDDDWSKVDNPADPLPAYTKSKTLAERAAWDFHKGLSPNESFELAVVNPGFVLGPMLSTAQCTSAELIQRVLHKTLPAVPDLWFSGVDVRDVALAHIKAMLYPDSVGQRYQGITFTFSLREMCAGLSTIFAPLGYWVPTWSMPGFLLRFIGLFDKTIGEVSKNLGRINKHDGSKFRALIGRPAIEWKQSIEEMTWSLIANGLVNPASEETTAKAKEMAKEILFRPEEGLAGISL